MLSAIKAGATNTNASASAHSSKSILTRGCDPAMAAKASLMLPPLLGGVEVVACTCDEDFVRLLMERQYTAVFFAPGACRFSAASQPIPGGSVTTRGWALEQYRTLVRQYQGEDVAIVETLQEAQIVPLLALALAAADTAAAAAAAAAVAAATAAATAMVVDATAAEGDGVCGTASGEKASGGAMNEEEVLLLLQRAGLKDTSSVSSGWVGASGASDTVARTTVTVRSELVQRLWAGYGQLVRLSWEHEDGSTRWCIHKHIAVPQVCPRIGSGGGADASAGASAGASNGGVDEGHARKLESYRVEARFYTHVSGELRAAGVAVPELLHADEDVHGGGYGGSLLMGDLVHTGFPTDDRCTGGRLGCMGQARAAAVWLGKFHAASMGRRWEEVHALWPEGAYWRLDTRQTELETLRGGSAATASGGAAVGGGGGAAVGHVHDHVHDRMYGTSVTARMYRAAPALAERLRTVGGFARGWTLVHGDYKSANLQFSCTGAGADAGGGMMCAALDFQYVGGGWGARDLVSLMCKSIPMDSRYCDFN